MQDLTTLTTAIVTAAQAGTLDIADSLFIEDRIRRHFAAEHMDDDSIMEALRDADHALDAMVEDEQQLSQDELVAKLDACLDVLKGAASLDELVDLMAAFADELAEVEGVDWHEKVIAMGHVDLGGLPTWGPDATGRHDDVWSWDETRVMCLDERFRPSLSERRDLDED